MPCIVIIGNSGSGKTFLAGKLSEVLSVPITHLDKLFWEPGGYNQKRPKEVVYQDIDLLKNKEAFIVEGVFGELAQEFLAKANCLIWLDMDKDNLNLFGIFHDHDRAV